MKILKIFIAVFILVASFTTNVFSSTESNNKEKERLMITTEELAKDLAVLQALIIQVNEQMKNMTPEERNKLCKELQEKYKKSPLGVPIQFEC